jgi:hypothetical protein
MSQKFTKWQVLQVALLFAFALSAFSGQAEIVVPKLMDAVQGWVSK